jgi:hypothetical protein
MSASRVHQTIFEGASNFRKVHQSDFAHYFGSKSRISIPKLTSRLENRVHQVFFVSPLFSLGFILFSIYILSYLLVIKKL